MRRRRPGYSAVIPAKAGIQNAPTPGKCAGVPTFPSRLLDSGFRRNDGRVVARAEDFPPPTLADRDVPRGDDLPVEVLVDVLDLGRGPARHRLGVPRDEHIVVAEGHMGLLGELHAVRIVD